MDSEEQENESVSQTEIVASAANTPSPKDVSASTIGRMMGLATVSDLQLIEGKLDLVVAKVAQVATRAEKIANSLKSMPTGSDLERIDVQIGGLKSMIRDALGEKVSDPGLSDEDNARRMKDGLKKFGVNIKSNQSEAVAQEASPEEGGLEQSEIDPSESESNPEE